MSGGGKAGAVSGKGTICKPKSQFPPELNEIATDLY